jgi:nucleoside-diphosphate-sugar epimerase
MPRWEFLYSDDLADACLFLMNLDQYAFASLVASEAFPPLINIGSGEDQTIVELTELVTEVVGFDGRLTFDASKPDGTPRKLLDSSRLSSLGWTPKPTLREGLQVACRDFLELRRPQLWNAAERCRADQEQMTVTRIPLTNKSFWWILHTIGRSFRVDCLPF